MKRRADREAEGARLLSEYTPKGYLGFESPALRHVLFLFLRAHFVFLQGKVYMAFFVRIYRIVPLVAVLIILAVVVYLVASFKFPSPKAKKIVIDMFYVITAVLCVFFILATLYAVLDSNMFGVELFASFFAVALIGLIIVAVCNHKFLKHYPQYKDKAVPARVHTWFEKFKHHDDDEV